MKYLKLLLQALAFAVPASFAFSQTPDTVYMCTTAQDAVSNAPNGVVYDSGGPQLWYNNGEYCSLLIDPGCAISITFTLHSLESESCCDYLYVYNGTDESAPLLGVLSGFQTQSTYVAASGKVFLRWRSDGSAVASGFRASWTSVLTAPLTPVASASVSDDSPALAQPIQFNASATNDPLEWQWDFGDGKSSNKQNPKHAYAQSGNFTARLIVRNCHGLKDTAFVPIVVQNPPAAGLTPASLNLTASCGDTVKATLTLTNTGTGDLLFGASGRFQNRVRVMLYQAGASNYIIQNLNAILLNNTQAVELSATVATDTAQLKLDLKEQDILIFPENYSDVWLFMGLAPALQQFVNDGGSIIFLGQNNYHGPISGSMLFSLVSPYAQDFSFNTLPIESHPITQGLPNQIFAPASCLGLAFSDPNYVDLSPELVNTYSILGYKEIGAAQIVYLGFNYNNYDAALVQLLLNAIEFCGTRNNLQATPPDGVVAPGDSVGIEVLLPTTELVAGQYAGQISVTTNDPAHPELLVPFELILQGQAVLEFGPTALVFDSLMQYLSASRTLYLANPGCDTLWIDQVGISSAVWDIAGAPALLPPFSVKPMTVIFNPLDTGAYQGILTFQTNIGNIPYALSGTAFGAPLAGLSPDSIEVTLSCGDSTSRTIVFSNTGLSQLDIQTGSVIDSSGTGIRALILDFSAVYWGPIFNSETWLLEAYPNASVKHFTSNDDPTTLPARMLENNLVIVPGMSYQTFVPNAVLGQYLNDYMLAGGTVIMTGHPYVELMNQMPFTANNGYAYSYIGDLTPVLPDHPLLQGLDVSQPVYEDVYSYQFTDPTFVTAASFNSIYTGLGYLSRGAGRFIYLGYECESYPITTARNAYLNAVRWGARPQWLLAGPLVTAAAPGQSAEVQLQIRTDELVAGTYRYDLKWLTNDPLHPQFILPVILHLEGAPEAELLTPDLNFGIIQQFTSKKMSVEVKNTGCDTLFLSQVSSDNTVFAPGNYPAYIVPKATGRIDVEFSPQTPGLQNAQLTVVTDAGTLSAALAGLAVGAPVTAVSPAAITVSMSCSESTTRTLSFDNTGQGDLAYQIGHAGPPLRVLALTWGANTWYWDNIRNRMNAELTDKLIFTYDWNDPVQLADTLKNMDVVVLPPLDGANTAYETWAPVLQNFVEQGGQAIAFGTYNNTPLVQMGLLPGLVGTSGYYPQINLLVPAHRALQGLPRDFTSTDNCYIGQFLPGSVRVLARADYNSNYAYLAVRSLGKGNIIYAAQAFQSFDPPGNNMLINLFEWVRNPLPAGASIPSVTGTVAPGNSNALEIQFDGTGLPGGTHSGYLRLVSNDPVNSPLFVPVTITASNKPCVEFGYSAPPCSGTYSFSDSTLNQLTSWFWTFGDGFQAFVKNPTHTYASGGAYTVTLVGCNNAGCDTLSRVVNVGPLDGPVNVACQPTTQSYCCGAGIFRVILNNLDHFSGSAAEGYVNNACVYGTELMAGSQYPITVITGQQFAEHVRAWIDFNNNGSFGLNELVFSDQASIYHQGFVTVPFGAVRNTPLRLRVSSDTNSNPQPEPCSSPSYGQVEDYYVVVKDVIDTREPSDGLSTRLYPNPSEGTGWLELELPGSGTAVLRIADNTGREVHRQTLEGLPAGANRLALPELPAGVWLVRVQVGEAWAVRKWVRVDGP